MEYLFQKIAVALKPLGALDLGYVSDPLETRGHVDQQELKDDLSDRAIVAIWRRVSICPCPRP
jgi:hypothetical protein